MVARTRMCRSAVAIMRGGNFCGAAWHRPQLARKRFSPSIRIVSGLSVPTTAEASADFLAELDPAQRGKLRSRAPNAAKSTNCQFFFNEPPAERPWDRAESENGRQGQS